MITATFLFKDSDLKILRYFLKNFLREIYNILIFKDLFSVFDYQNNMIDKAVNPMSVFPIFGIIQNLTLLYYKRGY